MPPTRDAPPTVTARGLLLSMAQRGQQVDMQWSKRQSYKKHPKQYSRENKGHSSGPLLRRRLARYRSVIRNLQVTPWYGARQRFPPQGSFSFVHR